MIVIFVAFLALVSGGSLLMKDREFSPNENRYLAEPPRLTVDNISVSYTHLKLPTNSRV